MRIRSPIIVTTGHVDHGKTTLLDKIRGTSVVKLEPGEITQHTGASYVPMHVIRKVCGELLTKLKIKLKVPGLLFIDVPGHEAFVTLRKRGGSVSDLAILVIDIMQGFQPQTDESLNFIKHFKTPFVVAATKIDLISGWYPNPDMSFTESYSKQSTMAKEELDKRVYLIVSQLAERGFEAERFDKVEDFTRQVAVVPTSGVTGEGIAELLMVLAGLAQRFLAERLKIGKEARGTVLEVKETVGLGTTIDLILYDGSIKVGDWAIIGGKKPIVTRIRALLRPPVLKELRVEKRFERVPEVSAAAGVKIAAPGLEEVIAGSPVIFVKDEKEVEAAKRIVQREVEEVEFTKEVQGVVAKADTLGSLEALIKMLSDRRIPIRKAEVGKVTKEDIIDVQNVREGIRRVVLAFNVKALKEAEEVAKNLRIPIFVDNVIYRLVEGYEKWCLEEKERLAMEKLAKVSRPCRLRMLGKDFVFRISKPAIFGVEVEAGVLRPGIRLCRPDGKIVGEVKRIESEGKPLAQASVGAKVAISVEDVTVGRQIGYDEVLTSFISNTDAKVLKEVWDKLHEDEKDLLKEWGLA